MTFKNTFCASPWFHARINNAGNFEYCRWATKSTRATETNIKDITPLMYFQKKLSPVRESMLQGQDLSGCADCHLMEHHHKVSGREKQMLKIGVSIDEFEPSMLSSRWIEEFKHSWQHDGDTNLHVQDWQIDLGNYCNSACVFCDGFSSSRLAVELKHLGYINNIPSAAWCDDPILLDKFVECLKQTPNIAYLHFIGGETLITPAFRTILQSLIDHTDHHKITIGFTTNLTTWNPGIITLLKQFRQVNLGMSIECMHPLNDYVRYGSSMEQVLINIDRYHEIAKANGWLLQLRITPTVLSIWHLDTVYHYALARQIAIESCNFLDEPTFMRPSVLPGPMRNTVIKKLESVLGGQQLLSEKIINTRNPDLTSIQIKQDGWSYVKYFRDQPDESYRLPELVRYLKMLESNRNNSIIEYLPEYEELFRSAGY